MRTLYFDCFAGASGNMILGGLIGLGIAEHSEAHRVRLGLEGRLPAADDRFAVAAAAGTSGN